MSGMGDRNRETPGVEAPGPIDRALDKDRDDRIDILEGTRDRQVGGAPNIQEGMQVYGANDQMIGRVESLHGDGFHVAGRHFGRDQVLRVEHNRIYLRGAGAMAGTDTGVATGVVEDREVRVPVVEERLEVGKREVDLGEVEIRRRVVEEEQNVPVTLRREEVTVRREDTANRPLRPGEEVFQEGTVRVPVRGEEAVVAKQAVVTGEVVVEKEAKTEERTVSDTVRRTEVDFDEDYTRARGGFERDFATRQAAATDDWGRKRTWAQAEPNYRAGYMAGADQRYAGHEFDTVEPELRRDYESGKWGTTGRDGWERLRQEVRHGFQTARTRAR